MKLLLQREKKHDRKAKASSSSFSGFLPSMPEHLCQLPSFAGTGVVTTTPSSMVCGDLLDCCSSCLRCSVCAACGCYSCGAGLQAKSCGIAEKRAKMLAAFEDIWTSSVCSSPHPGLPTATQPPLVTQPVPLPAVPAPVPPPVVLVAVSAASSAHLGSSSRLASSFCSHKQSRSSPSSGPHPVPVGPGLSQPWYPASFPVPSPFH